MPQMEELKRQLAAAKAAEGVISNETSQVHCPFASHLLEYTDPGSGQGPVKVIRSAPCCIYEAPCEPHCYQNT